tara:strand:+ start:1393 stop:1569 length:177 start_codon:yes stop_codon:yes gene_type:complete
MAASMAFLDMDGDNHRDWDILDLVLSKKQWKPILAFLPSTEQISHSYSRRSTSQRSGH